MEGIPCFSVTHFNPALRVSWVFTVPWLLMQKNPSSFLAERAEKKCRLAIAFIYLSDQLTESSVIEERVKTALARIVEKVTVSDANVAAVAPMKP